MFEEIVVIIKQFGCPYAFVDFNEIGSQLIINIEKATE